MSMKTSVLTAEISQREFLSHALAFYFENNFSFALWKLPHTNTVHFAASDKPLKLKEINMEESAPGFVFAPFDPAQDKIFLPADELFVFNSGRIITSQGPFLQSHDSKKTDQKNEVRKYHVGDVQPLSTANQSGYKELVEKSRAEVLRGTFEKIVPSRCKHISLGGDFDALKVFEELSALYPHALVSVFSSPISGTWVGATPEMLAGITRDQHFHTAAVAGTQPFTDGTDIRSVSWTQKDIEEQALVERYIISCFKKIRLREYDEHGPKTSIAGNVIHLKTDFEVDMVATNFPQLGTTMLKLLHPTSAVCGMPLQASLEFIRKHEGYERQYYSGFLGPLNIHQESHLYVNIRCMQLFDQQALLYAGAGVLADSDPDKEWIETEMKMNTLGRIIAK